jgi:hypothetical protein
MKRRPMSVEKDRATGEARSSEWPALRKKFLKGKLCAACSGNKKLEAHHIMPFHMDKSKELDVNNLIPLCEGNKDINCHLVMGHSFNFKGVNPNSVSDSARLLSEKIDNEKRVKEAQK